MEKILKLLLELVEAQANAMKTQNQMLAEIKIGIDDILRIIEK